MKRFYFFSIFIILTIGANAETSISLGIGPEVNKYSNSLVAAGVVYNMDYRFNEMFSIGARALYCIDLGQDTIGDVSVIEASANARLYFLRFRDMLFKYSLLWQNKLHWFFQFDLGGSFAFYPKAMEGVAYTGFNAGGMFGVRIVSETTYIEPFVRYSAMGGIGAGVMLGLTFAGSMEQM